MNSTMLMTKVRRDVLRQISARPMSSRDLAPICDRTTTELANVLKRLLDAGFVEPVGFAQSRLRGAKPLVYAITKAGMEFYSERAVA